MLSVAAPSFSFSLDTQNNDNQHDWQKRVQLLKKSTLRTTLCWVSICWMSFSCVCCAECCGAPPPLPSLFFSRFFSFCNHRTTHIRDPFIVGSHRRQGRANALSLSLSLSLSVCVCVTHAACGTTRNIFFLCLRRLFTSCPECCGFAPLLSLSLSLTHTHTHSLSQCVRERERGRVCFMQREAQRKIHMWVYSWRHDT
jgi:hypothetical protein